MRNVDCSKILNIILLLNKGTMRIRISTVLKYLYSIIASNSYEWQSFPFHQIDTIIHHWYNTVGQPIWYNIDLLKI